MAVAGLMCRSRFVFRIEIFKGLRYSTMLTSVQLNKFSHLKKLRHFRRLSTNFSISDKSKSDVARLESSCSSDSDSEDEGDSGYGIRNYMTPLLETGNDGEHRYNEAHIRTRVVVENTFGIWKRRFPILAYGCRTNINLTMNIIVATAILHNVARDAGEENPNDDNNEFLEQLIQNGNIPLGINAFNNNNNGQVRL